MPTSRRRLLRIFGQAGLYAAVALAAGVPSRAVKAQDDFDPAQGQRIRGVIRAQLRAFARDDAEGAFYFASPVIRRKFVTPDRFMTMVRHAYGPIYRNREVEFRALVVSGPDPVQEVFLVGEDGRAVIALYRMEQQPDGSWRISGVFLYDAPDQTS
jgi:hypothetical protein